MRKKTDRIDTKETQRRRHLRQALKEARVGKGYTLRELSDAARVDYNMTCNYLGQQTIKDLGARDKILSALGYNTEEEICAAYPESEGKAWSFRKEIPDYAKDLISERVGELMHNPKKFEESDYDRMLEALPKNADVKSQHYRIITAKHHGRSYSRKTLHGLLAVLGVENPQTWIDETIADAKRQTGIDTASRIRTGRSAENNSEMTR